MEAERVPWGGGEARPPLGSGGSRPLGPGCAGINVCCSKPPHAAISYRSLRHTHVCKGVKAFSRAFTVLTRSGAGWWLGPSPASKDGTP